MPFLAKLLATWFGTGLLPKAPGSWGSLAALPIAWVIAHTYGAVWVAIAAITVFIIGCWAAGAFARQTSSQDPQSAVIDEVAGQLLTVSVVPVSLPALIAGFFLFRFFDIVKPWPVSWADRAIHGGFGIMFDDILAAIYAGAALFVLHRLVFQGFL